MLGGLTSSSSEQTWPARIVINSRTGTAVINRNVKVSAVAVTHGAITVSISATNEVSQPEPFSEGETVEIQNAEIEVAEAGLQVK